MMKNLTKRTIWVLGMTMVVGLWLAQPAYAVSGTKVIDGSSEVYLYSNPTNRVVVKTTDGTWGMIVQRNGDGGYGLCLYKSTDGTTWSYVLQLSTETTWVADAALDSSNNMIVIMGHRREWEAADADDLYWRKLTYSAGTWSGGTNTAIGSLTDEWNDRRFAPHIVLESNTTWWITYKGNQTPGDAQYGYAAYTTNSGSTWTFSAGFAGHYRDTQLMRTVRLSNGIMMVYFINYYADTYITSYRRLDADAKTSWTGSTIEGQVGNWPNNYGQYDGDVALVADTSNNVYLIYFKSTSDDDATNALRIAYRKWTNSTSTWGAATYLDSTNNYEGLRQSVDAVIVNDVVYFFYLKADGKIYYRKLDGGGLGAETLFCDDTDMYALTAQGKFTGSSTPIFYTKATAPNTDAFVLMFSINAAPNAPSSLSPAAGAWTNDNTPTLSFTQSDPDAGNTVKYRIQIDDTSTFASPVVDYTSALIAQGATSFTVGQAAGTGTYTVGSAGQTLANGSYYWRVMSTDNNNASSGWATANGGAVAFGVDATAPDTTFSSTSESGTGTTYTYPNGQTVYFSSLMGGTATQITITVTASDTGGSGLSKVTFGAFNDETALDDTASPYSRAYNLTSADAGGSITVTAYDTAGNADATPVTITMTKDTTAPTAGTLSVTESSSYLYVSGANFYYSAAMGVTDQTATFSISGASDAGAGLQYITFPAFFGESAVNDTSSPYSEGYLINNTDTSTGSFTSTTVDNVGNSASTNTITVTKDTTAPTITSPTITETSSYLYLSGTNLYYSDGMAATPQDATFNGSSSDAGAGLYQATFSTAFGDSPGADATPATWSGVYTIINTDTGTQTLTVTVSDNVGNTSQSSITCYEDVTAPTAGTLSASESSSYLYVSGSDFYYSDSMGATDQTATFSISGASDAGAGLQYITFPAFFGESAVNDTTGPYSEDYLINNADTSTGSFTCTTVDNVGNSASTNTITVTKDTTSPTITSPTITETSSYLYLSGTTLYYSDGMGVTAQNADFNGTSSDAGSGLVQATFSTAFGDSPGADATPATWSGIYTVVQADTGAQALTVTISDNVGNTATSTINGVEDVTSPTITGPTITETSSYLYLSGTTLYYSDGMGVTAQNADFNGTSSDAGSGLTQATFSTAFGDSPSADATPATWSGVYTIVQADTGAQTLTVTISDNVGNTSQSTINGVEDTTAPTISSPTITETSSYLYLSGTNLYYSDGMGVTAQNADFNGTSSDGGSGLTQATFSTAFGDTPSADATPATWSGIYTVVQADTGAQALTVTISDNVGNTATSTINGVEDVTGPTISSPTITETSSYLYLSGTNLYYSDGMAATPQDANFNGTSSDAGAGLTQATFSTAFGDTPSADATPATWSGVYTVVQADTGAQTLTVTVSDNVGNTATSTINGVEDVTGPTISSPTITETSAYLYLSGTNLYYSDGMGVTAQNADFNGTSSDAGAGLTQATFSSAFGDSPGADATPATWSGVYTVVAADTGAQTLTVTISDNVGNTATSTINGVEDVTSPTITSPTITETSSYLYLSGTTLYYSDGMGVTAQNADFNGTSSDGGSGLTQATFSSAFGDSPAADATPATWSGVYTVVAADTGAQTLTVTISDNAGNTATATINGVEDVIVTAPGAPTFGTVTTTSIIVNKPTDPSETGAGLYQWQGRRGGATELGWQALATTTYTDTPLTPNTQYTYDVQFSDNVGNTSAFSTAASKYTLAAQPTVSAFSNITGTSIQANWGANNNAAGTQYYVEFDTGTTFVIAEGSSGWITTTNWNKTGLAEGVSYSFRVKAKNGEDVETAWVDLGYATIVAGAPSITSINRLFDNEKTADTTPGFTFTGTDQ